MNINTNNYSLSHLSDTKYSLTDNIPFIDANGCNGFVRNSRSKYIYLVIPKRYVDEVLDHIYTLTNIRYTLDNIVDIFGEMSFKYNYEYIDKSIVFQYGITVEGYYVFEIENTINQYHRYYAFCMIRHFYYAQDILTMYMNVYHKLNSELEKILALSIFSSIQSGYSFVGPIVQHNVKSFTDLLDSYYINRSNSLQRGIRAFSIQSVGYRYNNKDTTIILNRIKHLKEFLDNHNPESIFYDDNTKSLLKDYIESYGVNIISKQLSRFKVWHSNAREINDIISYEQPLKVPDNSVIPNKPSIYNIEKKLLPKKKLFVEPKNPKFVINLTKSSRAIYDSTVNIINRVSSINSLKNREFLNKITLQEEADKFPLRLVKKIKTRNEVSITINSKKELDNYNLKNYIKQPIIKDSEEHFLFFTKNELFLYQVKKEDRVVDNLGFNITKDMLKTSHVEKCTEAFLKSGLDIGVVICDVKKNNLCYIKDITPFVYNGDFSRDIFFKEINNITCIV